MTYNKKLLVPIDDPVEIDRIYENLSWVVRHIVQNERLVDVTLFKKAGWVAVPAERYSHVIEMNQEQLRRVFPASEYSELLAVALDPMGAYPSVYKVAVTVQGIQEFNHLWHPFNCALLSGEPDWVIISTDSDFDVVAGPAEFVCQLLGCGI